MPDNSHGIDADAVKRGGRRRGDKAGDRYKLQAYKSAHVIENGRVRSIRSLNGQELSVLRSMLTEDASPSTENTLHLLNFEYDSLRKIIDQRVQRPTYEDCNDPLVVRLATLQEDVQEWEAERDWWDNMRREGSIRVPTGLLWIYSLALMRTGRILNGGPWDGRREI